MKKTLLIMLVILLIPSLSLAKEFRDNTYNFQLDLPEKWLIEEDNNYAAKFKTIEKPIMMIFIKAKTDQDNKINYNKEPDERLKEKIVPAYINKIKSEMPSANIQSATVSSFKYNKGIVVSYLVKDSSGHTHQGVDAYFVLSNLSYSFYLLCQPEDSKIATSQFFEMLNTFKQSFILLISDGVDTVYLDSNRYKITQSQDGEYFDCWVKFVTSDKTRYDHLVFDKDALTYLISESYIYNQNGDLINQYRNPSNERRTVVPGSKAEHLIRTIKQLNLK